eukprot:TRINITY_DN9286_c0_g1_i6.p1 TRINITY_DN9286_c0_g1~~TRINITY_DN9286_c0_g1_i6.p1  ORF type:complete len:349 (-),score=76.74 TRINITY_DN9286_c0_g1_i6:19-1065(-)
MCIRDRYQRRVHGPYVPVVITPKFASSIDFISPIPPSLNLSAERPVGTVIFRCLPNAQAGNNTTISYGLSGSNSFSYLPPASHRVTVEEDTRNLSQLVPQLNVSVSSTDAGKATSKELNFNVSVVETPTIYYCMTTSLQEFTTGQLIQLGTDPTASSTPSQQQCAFFIASSGENKRLLTGLIPSQNYWVSAIAISVFNKSSTVFVSNFTMASNGGIITRVLFEFNGSYPSAETRNTLLCALTVNLNAAVDLIVDVHNSRCNATSSGPSFNGTNNTNGTSGLNIWFLPTTLEVDTLTKDLERNLLAMKDKLNATLGASANWFNYTVYACLLYTSPSPRDRQKSRMPSSA